MKAGLFEPIERRVGTSDQQFSEMELRGSLPDLDRPDLDRPPVDVLNQSAVGFLKPGQCEGSGEGVPRELLAPEERQIVLGLIECRSVGLVEEITKNGRPRVDVRIEKLLVRHACTAL